MEARKSSCSNLQTNERIAIADGAPAEYKDDMDGPDRRFLLCEIHFAKTRKKTNKKGNFLSQYSLSF
jgi:hypothetical protein